MQWINKNLEKIIFFVLLCLFLVSMFYSARKSAVEKHWFLQKMQGLKAIGQQEKSEKFRPYEDDYARILKEMERKPEEYSLSEVRRNLFERFVPKAEKINEPVVLQTAPIFELLEIGYKPLEIEYQGRVVFDEGKIIAQVNVHGKTYLVSEGAKMGEIKVINVNKDYVELQDSSAKIIRLNYKQITYSNELVAQIKEQNLQTVFKVNVGSDLLGYKVLDIGKDFVLLSKQAQHLRLEKGMVRK